MEVDVTAVAGWDIRTAEYHTAGEPFRIVADLPFEIPGATVLERRENALPATSDADLLRRMLVNEPRGHADMYGGFIVPPNDDGAHFGVLFWHKDGFSTACGHGTMALGAWAVRSGLVQSTGSGMTDVVIDVPSGRVVATVHVRGGRVETVTFRNVPSRVIERDVTVSTADFGAVSLDMVWAGATYACLPASAVGLSVDAQHLTALIEAGRQVKATLAVHPAGRHPSDHRLDGVYGTIFFEDADVPGDSAQRPAGSLAQRNVTIFADGQVDRSPCGSGTGARVAALDAAGRLGQGGVLDHFSIVGTHFSARVIERAADGVIVETTGAAYPVGDAHFTIDPADELGLGFTLR